MPPRTVLSTPTFTVVEFTGFVVEIFRLLKGVSEPVSPATDPVAVSWTIPLKLLRLVRVSDEEPGAVAMIDIETGLASIE